MFDRFLAGSWKTTVFGMVLLLCGTFLLWQAMEHGMSADKLLMGLMALAGGGGLVVARDDDRTSEQVGAASSTGGNRGNRGATLLLALGVAAFSVGLTGCQTKPVKLAAQTEAATVTTVDGCMRGWADWVNAGKASKGDVDKVQAAYGKYYAAQTAAKAGLELWVSGQDANGTGYQQAKASADAAKGALLDLVNVLMNPPTK